MMEFQECFEQFTPESRVLDVGCGIGDLSAEMSKRVPLGTVLGVDNSYKETVQASRRFPRAKYPNLRFQTADARTLRLKEEPFDFVVSRACLHFIQWPGTTFPVMARHLRKGGCLHVWFLGKGNGEHIHKCLRKLAVQAQWKDYFGGFQPNYYFVSPRSCDPWLSAAHLRKNRVDLVDQPIDFPSREIFLQWLQWGWRAYWERIPAFRQEEFNQDFLKLYASPEGPYRAHLVWLAIDATKF